MYFTTKFASLLFAVAASAVSVQAAVAPRHDLAQVSVVLWEDTELRGASFSPASLVPGVCTTLPGEWLDRAESALISSGFACTFFAFEGCEGTGTALSGQVNELPNPSLYNNVESFTCNKQI